MPHRLIYFPEYRCWNPQDIHFKCCLISYHLRTSVDGLPLSIQHYVRALIGSKIRFHHIVSLEFLVNLVTVQSAIFTIILFFLSVCDCDVHVSLLSLASFYGCHIPINVLCDLHDTSYLFQRLGHHSSLQFGTHIQEFVFADEEPDIEPFQLMLSASCF